MDDFDDQDVEMSAGNAQSAAVGTDDAGNETPATDFPSQSQDPSTPGDAEIGKLDESDFEAVLFESETSPDEAVSLSTEPPKEDTKLSVHLQTLKEVRESLDKLTESPDEAAKTKILRRLNRELLTKHEAEVAEFSRIAQYGDVPRIEEALTLLDGLYGYDTDRGAPSAHKAAEMIVAKEPAVAYNLALNVLRHADANGTPFAEHFTRHVLKLDPQRLSDFQAISRGEMPEGYEGTVDTSEDLARIDPQLHDAYKRLSPKLKEIVTEGFDQYASPGEKAEAMRLLQESQLAINVGRDKARQDAEKEAQLAKNLETTAVRIEQEATETIGTRIQNGLDKIAFSSDSAVDLTMKQAVNMQIFNLVHESAYVRERAESYFKAMNVDIASERSKIDYWFGRLNENIDIETVARTKGQTQAAERAHSVRKDAEVKLAAIGLKLIASIANKTKAGLRARGEAKVPENQLPPRDSTSSSSVSTNGSFDYRAAAAATREGRVLRSR